jgi:hypothetical protein
MRTGHPRSHHLRADHPERHRTAICPGVGTGNEDTKCVNGEKQNEGLGPLMNKAFVLMFSCIG